MNSSYSTARKSAVQTRNDYGGRAKRAKVFAGDVMGTEVWAKPFDSKANRDGKDKTAKYKQWKKAGVKPYDTPEEKSRKMRAAGFEYE